METTFEIVDKSKDSMKLKMLHYDNTLLRPFVEELMKDEMVEESRYYIKHPVIDDPEIYVRVKSGKPQAAVKRSVKRLSKTFEDMSQDLSRELRRIDEKQ
ncbi:MAG: DNA-directed RNA polymerase subunit L [Candidatus Thermoplasmatota archaeon]|nr:DNA-directed RNA polymerase subunit L [Candidatus Thermoplasmatota archaeon]MCL5665860.1 DNA-directed RNA polymerase subunit L [Candidatus Thermoplasmatota archaeon]